MQITVLDEQAAAPVGTAELVARARNGDRVAWDGLVDRYGGTVWAVARAHGLDARDAGDVSQVTWLLLTQHLALIRQPERLEAWLLRTATREAYRMRRLRGYEQPDGLLVVAAVLADVAPLAYGVAMATWDDVRRLALALPQTAEGTSREGLLGWSVNGKTFAWERPLRRGDLQALGDAAPQGPVLAARVPDLGAKEALLATGGEVYFTTPHFNGYPAILIRLDRMALPDLEELLVEAWLARAPKRLAAGYLAAR